MAVVCIKFYLPDPKIYLPRAGRQCLMQGTHCTGKTGKMGNLAKTQGIWFAQVVNSLILKVKDISKFAAKISQKHLTLDKSAKSVLCM